MPKIRHVVQIDFEGFNWRSFSEYIGEYCNNNKIPDNAHLIFSGPSQGFSNEMGNLPTGKRYAQLTWEEEL